MSDAVQAATPAPVQASPAPVDSAPVQNTSQSPAPSPTPPSPNTSGVGVVEGQVALASAEQPAPEQSKPDAAIAEKPPVKSLLGSEPVKPDVAPKPEAETQADAAQPVETPLPTYKEFVVPEGVTADPERLGNFSKMLSEFEHAKPDHDGFQDFGQKLIEFHADGLKKAIEHLNTSYQQAFEQRKNEWKESFFKDPEIGGNRQQTTLNAAIEAINIHGGTSEQQADFRKLMDETGVGNHPAMIRMLSNINTALREGRPIAAQSPVPEKLGKLARMYGTSMGTKS